MNEVKSFEDLGLPAPIAKALVKMKFTTPTPIQIAAIPPALEGRDILGTAQTGTGKTAAFGIPLIAKLLKDDSGHALVLAPTRELAAQIFDVLSRIGAEAGMRGVLIVGGEPMDRQRRLLRNGCDFLVATPGRLIDHLSDRSLQLGTVRMLVLDEVDRMLDMGFTPQLKIILREVPKDRQTLCFSATLPDEVLPKLPALVRNAARVSVQAQPGPSKTIAHEARRLRQDEKTGALLEELGKREGRVLVFVRTQIRASKLVRALAQQQIASDCLHGGRTQAQRRKAIASFRGGQQMVLIATDLAGRGLDVPEVDHVINFDVPATREDFVHRIGRTGRAGRSGSAMSFVVAGDRGEERIVRR